MAPQSNSERLAGVGPRDAESGFPLWYADANGVRLGPGLAADPLTPAVGDVNRALPLRVEPPANFPDEFFYFLAESRMTVGGDGRIGRARLVLALEAAFGGTGEPDPSARVVFSRLRVRIDDVVPGATYVVSHPYGITRELQADDRGRVFDTEDRGLADEDFTAVVAAGLVAPFLTWDTGLVTTPTGSYLGDGATEHRVTGSPFGRNYFRIDGPRIGEGAPRDPDDPGNVDRAQHDLFTVQGRIATRLGVQVDRLTYDRPAAGPVIFDLFASSAPGCTIELGGPGLPRTAALVADNHYIARTQAPTLPATVVVVNASDDPGTSLTVSPVDRVLVDAADFDCDSGTLTVHAVSSDEQAGPLTLQLPTGPVPLGAGPTTVPLGAPPAVVTVTSSAGGTGTRPVTLTGSPLPPLPVIARAGQDRTVAVGRLVTLDGSGSAGAITGWQWTQTAGDPVALTDPTGPVATCTPTTPGICTFRLAVTTGTETATDDVTVTVTPPPPPDAITVQRAEFRTGSQQYRVNGTFVGTLPAEVVVSFGAAEVGRSGVDATGAWAMRTTLTAATAGLRPTVGDSVSVTSANGPAVSRPIIIRN